MKFSRKDILKQLHADLIGKDSYRGVTLTYSWLANQFGHFSLGFIPTFMLYVLFINCFPNILHPSVVAPIVISVIWLLFELYNFLKPLLFNKSTEQIRLLNNTYVFKPAWKNVAFDTFTDLCFFWIGAFVAGEFCKYIPQILIVIGILIALLIPFSYYWYTTKMFLQAAQYPFQFRLSQWNSEISEEDKNTVLNFLEHSNSGKHLFVFGSRKSGKTSISVGIATEKSIQHCTCSYTTAMKLYSMFYESDEKLLEDTTTATWTWRDASLLIIDDINPGDPIDDELVNAKKFCALLDTDQTTNNANREIIKNKNVIWVLGNEDPNKLLQNSWQNMLEEIGVKKENILTINLLPNRLF